MNIILDKEPIQKRIDFLLDQLNNNYSLGYDEGVMYQIELNVLNKIIADSKPETNYSQTETLEEFINHSDTPDGYDQYTYDEGIRVGAKWQAERMFTKNDIIKAFYTDRRVWKNRFQDWVDVDFEEWFEKEFKKE
jgi:hypothetical protein